MLKKLSPLPKIAAKRKRNRPSEPAKLLTSTPEKLALEAKKESKDSKATKRLAKAAKKVFSSVEPEQMARPKKVAVMKQVKTKAARKFFAPSTSKKASKANKDAECVFCLEKFSDNVRGETWVECKGCGDWSHEACGKGDAHYFCPICVPE